MKISEVMEIIIIKHHELSQLDVCKRANNICRYLLVIVGVLSPVIFHETCFRVMSCAGDASSLMHGFRHVLRGVCDGDVVLDRRRGIRGWFPTRGIVPKLTFSEICGTDLGR